MTSNKVKLLLFLLLLLTTASLLSEERKAKLAVMEIEDQTGKLQKELLESATEYLRAKMAASSQFIVIDKSRQSLIRKKQQETYKDCYDKNCQIPLGQALSADTIVRSTVTVFAGGYTLNSELVDLAKEATVKAGNAEFDGSDAGLKQAVLMVVSQLTGIKPKQKQVELIRPYKWYAIGSFAFAGAAITAAILFDSKGADAKKERDDLSDLYGSDPTEEEALELQQKVDDVKSYRDMRLYSYIGAGVFAAAGTALFFITEEKPGESPVSFYFDDKTVYIGVKLNF